MISKLPRWIEFGAFLLAGLAGTVNAIGLMGFQHQSISHLSGTVTLLGSSLYNANGLTLHLLFIALSFMFGAAMSGFYIESSALRLGRRYGVALCTEGALLFLALYALINGSLTGHYFASAACGLQNAMITTYSGAIIRTTHMTGLITDLGIMLGERLKGRPFDRRKATLFLFIISGFISGGAFGAALFSYFDLYALAFPASFAFVIAICYSTYLYVNNIHSR